MSKRLTLMLLMTGVVALLASGCAITDYPVITDTDYCVNANVDMEICYDGCDIAHDAKDDDKDTGSDKTNTKDGYHSDAHIVETTQAAVIFTDGTEELVSDVHQSANGDQTIYTYSHYCAGSDGNSPAANIFHGDVYCNPMKETTDGCVIAAAPNPVSGDVDVFDYTLDTTCQGTRALGALVSFLVRTAECGLPSAAPGTAVTENTTFGQVAKLLDKATPTVFRGHEVLRVDLNKDTVSGILSVGSGSEKRIEMLDMGSANIGLFIEPGVGRGANKLAWDLRGANNATFLSELADKLGDGAVAVSGTITVHDVPFTIGGDTALALRTDGLRSIAGQVWNAEPGRNLRRIPTRLTNPHIESLEKGLR